MRIRSQTERQLLFLSTAESLYCIGFALKELRSARKRQTGGYWLLYHISSDLFNTNPKKKEILPKTALAVHLHSFFVYQNAFLLRFHPAIGMLQYRL